MADLLVAQELQSFFVAQGAAQLPSTSPSLTIPAVWLQPRDGAPLPRNLAKDSNGRWIGETTITIQDPMLGSPSNLEEWMEEAFLDIIVRSPQSATAQLTHRVIRNLIVPVGSSGGQKMWMCNDLLVEYSDEWRKEQEAPQLRSVAEHDPHSTYDRVASYRFMCRRKSLAGLPYTP